MKYIISSDLLESMKMQFNKLHARPCGTDFIEASAVTKTYKHLELRGECTTALLWGLILRRFDKLVATKITAVSKHRWALPVRICASQLAWSCTENSAFRIIEIERLEAFYKETAACHHIKKGSTERLQEGDKLHLVVKLTPVGIDRRPSNSEELRVRSLQDHPRRCISPKTLISDSKGLPQFTLNMAYLSKVSTSELRRVGWFIIHVTKPFVSQV